MTLAWFYFSYGHAKINGVSAKNTAHIGVSCVPYIIDRLDSRPLGPHARVSGDKTLIENRVGIHEPF